MNGWNIEDKGVVSIGNNAVQLAQATRVDFKVGAGTLTIQDGGTMTVWDNSNILKQGATRGTIQVGANGKLIKKANSGDSDFQVTLDIPTNVNQLIIEGATPRIRVLDLNGNVTSILRGSTQPD